MQGFIINKSRQGLTVQAKILQHLVNVAHINVDFLFKRVKHNRLIAHIFIILSCFKILAYQPNSPSVRGFAKIPTYDTQNSPKDNTHATCEMSTHVI